MGLANEIGDPKESEMSCEEYIKELLRVEQQSPEVSEWDKTPDTVHMDDPTLSEQEERDRHGR